MLNFAQDITRAIATRDEEFWRSLFHKYPPFQLDMPDETGKTILQHAFASGIPCFVEIALEELLVKDNLISADEAELILLKNDINARESIYGCNAFIKAALRGNLTALKRLLAHGANPALKSYFGSSAAHYAVQYKQIAVFNYLMHILPPETFWEPNAHGENVLHLAAEHQEATMVNRLLRLKFGEPYFLTRDVFGRTAISVASLTETEKLQSIEQTLLSNNLTTFLNLIGRDGRRIIHNQGNCNGWEFLYSIYDSNGKEEEFFRILHLIASWDKKLPSLYNDQLLPKDFKDQYGYRHLADLFEQIANDLCIFQYYAPAAQDLGLGYRWFRRLKQYALVGNGERKLHHLFSFSNMQMNEEQLAHMLRFLARWQGASIDVIADLNHDGRAHAMSINVTPDGLLKYYDGNARYPIAPFADFQALAHYMMETVYHNPASRLEGGVVNIGFNVFKFYQQAEVIPEIEVPHLEGFTPLAMALKCKQLPRVQALLAAHDVRNIAAEIDFNDLAQLCTEDVSFIAHLFANGFLHVNDRDKNGRGLLHCAIAQDNPLLTFMLLQQPDVDVNLETQGIQSDWTPLMVAMAYDAHKEVVRALLDKPEITLVKAMDVAIEYQAAKEIFLEIFHKASLSPNALRYALERNLNQSTLLQIIRDPRCSPNLNDLIFALRNKTSSRVIKAMVTKNPKLPAGLFAIARYTNQPDLIVLALLNHLNIEKEYPQLLDYGFKSNNLSLCRLIIQHVRNKRELKENLPPLTHHQKSLLFSKINRTQHVIIQRPTFTAYRPFILR